MTHCLAFHVVFIVCSFQVVLQAIASSSLDLTNVRSVLLSLQSGHAPNSSPTEESKARRATTASVEETNMCYDSTAYLPEHKLEVYCIMTHASWQTTCCGISGEVITENGVDKYCKLNAYNHGANLDSKCQELGGTVVTDALPFSTCHSYMARMIGLYPTFRGPASCEACLANIGDSNVESNLLMMQFYYSGSGCCGAVDAFTACHRACGYDVSRSFPICENDADFTPVDVFESRCSENTGQCNSFKLEGNCHLHGYAEGVCSTYSNAAAQTCLAKQGLLSEVMTCGRITSQYGPWGKTTLPQSAQSCSVPAEGDHVTSSLPTLGSRARVIASFCCKNRRSSCRLTDQANALVYFSGTTCSTEMASSIFPDGTSFFWDLCQPSNYELSLESSDVTTFGIPSSPQNFMATCLNDGGVEFKTSMSGCPTTTSSSIMQLGLDQLRILVAGGCATDITGTKSIKANGVPFTGVCGELTVPIGTERPFPGFGQASGFGCEGRYHFADVQDALDTCKERADCVGVSNPGCKMADESGVYSLCQQGTMRCCKEDCSYMKADEWTSQR